VREGGRLKFPSMTDDGPEVGTEDGGEEIIVVRVVDGEEVRVLEAHAPPPPKKARRCVCFRSLGPVAACHLRCTG